MNEIYVASGAGFSNDRRDLGEVAARSLLNFDGPRYLIFECLAERTLALAQGSEGLALQTERALSFLMPCIELCARENIKIISNFGGSDPKGVAQSVHIALTGKGIDRCVGIVEGDRIEVSPQDKLENEISRNAYIGARGIVEALSAGADIVVAGRVADPSLVVGPMMFESGLGWQEWDGLALATLAGHLIECGTQVCGGYFADVGSKEVPDLADVGPPVACINLDQHSVTICKPRGGGCVTEATVKEQLLYEIHDPSCYLTPDVVLDISDVRVSRVGENRVTVSGCKGRARPDTLKTLACLDTGWIGEGEISYMGDTSLDRARMAREILAARFDRQFPGVDRHFDFIGAMNHEGATSSGRDTQPRDVRLRVAIAHRDRALIDRALDEVEALYLNGPGGGGGVRRHVSRRTVTHAGTVPQADAVSVGSILAVAS